MSIIGNTNIVVSFVESFLESILLLKGPFFTHYITILYCIHMPCILIINLYYTSEINIIQLKKFKLALRRW